MHPSSRQHVLAIVNVFQPSYTCHNHHIHVMAYVHASCPSYTCLDPHTCVLLSTCPAASSAHITHLAHVLAFVHMCWPHVHLSLHISPWASAVPCISCPGPCGQSSHIWPCPGLVASFFKHTLLSLIYCPVQPESYHLVHPGTYHPVLVICLISSLSELVLVVGCSNCEFLTAGP